MNYDELHAHLDEFDPDDDLWREDEDPEMGRYGMTLDEEAAYLAWYAGR